MELQKYEIMFSWGSIKKINSWGRELNTNICLNKYLWTSIAKKIFKVHMNKAADTYNKIAICEMKSLGIKVFIYLQEFTLFSKLICMSENTFLKTSLYFRKHTFFKTKLYVWNHTFLQTSLYVRKQTFFKTKMYVWKQLPEINWMTACTISWHKSVNFYENLLMCENCSL